MPIRSYRDLIVWQSGMRLAEGVYRASSQFPRSELFGLRVQIQRCAVSIPSNIAEGHARESTREFLRFLSIATGSAAELQTQIVLANRLGYIDTPGTEGLLEQAGQVMKMLHGLRNSLRKRLKIDFRDPTECLFPNP
jgi:four helix bundle protein